MESPMPLRADVVVLGGGSAGVVAAIAAARKGADTLVVERYGFLGGTATIIHTYVSFLGDNGVPVIGGLPEEIIREVVRLGGGRGHLPDPTSMSATPVDIEVYKYVAMEQVRQAGARCLLHTWFVSAEASDGAIRNVAVYNKSGYQRIEGKVFIDATGDGDLAVAAGAPWEQGNAEGGLQPLTMTFRMAGFNRERFVRYIVEHPEEVEKPKTWSTGFSADYFTTHPDFPFFKGLDKLVARVARETGYQLPRDRVHFSVLPRPGMVQVNIVRISGIDAADAAQLTDAEFQGRRQAFESVQFLVKHVPGFEEAYLLDTPMQIGIRETRRILGEYVLTKDDVLEGRKFPDAIGQGIYPLDIHDPGGRAMVHLQPKAPYQFPYRILTPRGLSNCLVAGRCISATHEALGAARVVGNCMVMGQAAGTAAALAVQQGVGVKALDAQVLRAELAKDGAIF